MKFYLFISILCTLLVILSGCIEDNSVDSLINDLDNENASIKNTAIEKLSQKGDENTISSLLLNISLDEEEEKTVRMSSILALGEIGNETMLMPLANLSYGDDGLILYHAGTKSLQKQFKRVT
ncbi:MAG: hypothetical protein PWQ50_874 [Methanolobus sp.]|nr:hypothetical protein [Methanolobus sp.]